MHTAETPDRRAVALPDSPTSFPADCANAPRHPWAARGRSGSAGALPHQENPEREVHGEPGERLTGWTLRLTLSNSWRAFLREPGKCHEERSANVNLDPSGNPATQNEVRGP